MASRVLVAPQALVGQPGFYPALQPGAGTLAIAFQAADASLKNYTPLVGSKTYLLAMNTDATNPYTVSVLSVADEKNRKGDVTTYSLAAITGTTPVVAQFGPFASAGWLTPTDGQTAAGLWFEASNAAIKFAVITLN